MDSVLYVCIKYYFAQCMARVVMTFGYPPSGQDVLSREIVCRSHHFLFKVNLNQTLNFLFERKIGSKMSCSSVN